MSRGPAGAGDRGHARRSALEELENVLFDLDGCIWYGNEAAPGAAEIVERLRESGRRVFFLTNASMAEPRALADKLGRLGIAAGEEEVVSPLAVAHRHPVFTEGGPARALVVGKPAVARALERNGIEVTADPGRADAVVVGNSTSLTFGDLVPALAALDAGARLLALNLDRRVPIEGGRWICGSGAIVAALTTASGASAELVGKPSRFYFDTALERFGITPERTAIVGDSPDTDIAGGLGAGLFTVQVGTSRPKALARSDPEPHMAVADLPELLAAFRTSKGVIAV